MANETDEKAVPSTENTEQHIPYSRFAEVIEERNEFKTNLEKMREEIETLKTSLPKEPEPDPADWKEVKERAVKEAMSKMEEKYEKARIEEEKQEEAIESGFEKLTALGQTITPEVRKAVLTEMVKTGENVYDTYLSVKEKLDKTDKVKQLKEDNIPAVKGGTDNNTIGLTYKQLHSMSIDDIIARSEGKK
jgi:hypothetical protein